MSAIVDPPRATSSPPPAAQAQSQSPSYFQIVTSNLLKLGALTLEDFLRDPYQEPTPQENFLSNPLYHNVPLAPFIVPDQGAENGKPAPTPAPIFILEQICSQTFGSVNALNYEIIEEEGKESKLFFSFRVLPLTLSIYCPKLFLQRSGAYSQSRGLMAQHAHTHRNPNLRARQRPAPPQRP
jgi:hypothetical protein